MVHCKSDNQEELDNMNDMEVFIKNGNEVSELLKSNSLKVEDFSGQVKGSYAYVYLLSEGDFLILSADAALNNKKGFLVKNFKGDFQDFDVKNLPYFKDKNQNIVERNNDFILKYIEEMNNAVYDLEYFKDNFDEMRTYYLNEKNDEQVVTYLLNYMFYLKNTLDLSQKTEALYGDYFRYENYIVFKGGMKRSMIDVIKSFQNIKNDFISFHKENYFCFKPGVKIFWK